MKKIKVFAIVLAVVLSLTGGIFALSKLGAKSYAKADAACCSDSKCCEGGSCKTGGSCCSAQKSSHAVHPAVAAVTENNTTTTASCCGDASCCENGVCKMGGECCKDHASCPMKKSGETVNAVKAATEETGKSCHKNMTAEAGESCCKQGASCCNGGACCKAKTETAKL